MVAIPMMMAFMGCGFRVASCGKEEIALGGVGLLCSPAQLERLPRLYLVGAIRQGHDVPDGARVFLYAGRQVAKGLAGQASFIEKSHPRRARTVPV